MLQGLTLYLKKMLYLIFNPLLKATEITLKAGQRSRHQGGGVKRLVRFCRH